MSATPDFAPHVSQRHSRSVFTAPSALTWDLRQLVMGHAVRMVAAAVAYQVYLAGGLSLRFTLLSLVDGVFIGLLAPLMALCGDHRSKMVRAVMGLWNGLGALSLATLTWMGVTLARDFPRDVEAFTAAPNALLVVSVLMFCAVSHALVALQQQVRRPA